MRKPTALPPAPATPRVPIFDRDRALYRHVLGDREVCFQLDDGDDGALVVEYASDDDDAAPHDPALRAELQRLVDADGIPPDVFVAGDIEFADYVEAHYSQLRAEASL